MDKTRPITPPGRIACDPPSVDTRLKLLEHVNKLNRHAAVNHTCKTYWATTVLYNTVVYEQDCDGVSAIHEVYEGILK